MPLKVRPFVRNARRLLVNPFADLELVQELVEAVADWFPVRAAYARLVARIDKEEAAHLAKLTREPIDLPALRALPPASFGRHFATYLDRHGLDPDYYLNLYPPVRPAFHANWLLWRFGKCHDMHHTLLDVGVSVPEEFGLQVFNVMNFGEPLCLSSIAISPYILLRYPDQGRTLSCARDAIRLSRRIRNLLTFPFEDHYQTDLAELRRICHVPEGGLFPSQSRAAGVVRARRPAPIPPGDLAHDAQ